MLVKSLRYYVKKLKDIPAESWVRKPEDATKKFSDSDLTHLNIRYFRDVKRQLNVSLEENPQPVSPIEGPLSVKLPKIHNKIYRWCSCGQSLKQPFCDNSHKGTAFKPFKFTIEEKVKEIELCGCKRTSQKPFCDGESCQSRQIVKQIDQETVEEPKQ